MSSNNFNKQLLTRYVESECKRQLFLDLAQIKPTEWYIDKRPIEPPKRKQKRAHLLKELGKIYEQKVYSKLIKLIGAKYYLNSKNNVDETYLNPSLFSKLYDDLKKAPFNDLILLEHQFEIPDSFFMDLFPKKGSSYEIPVNYADQRPDIIVIGKSLNNCKDKVLELFPDGVISEVPKNELNFRFGINIIDIKNIREDHIGKKQFIEIFYYLWTLARYLKEHDLDRKFFIRIDFNGIFPQYNDDDLNTLLNFDDIIKKSIFIHWNESYQIFIDIINKIKKIWSLCPLPIESIPLNIQASCGYCYFIEDCKKTLGMDGLKSPKDWSLKLIPYTSASIAQQLIDLDFHTIEDVAIKIDNVKVGNTPEPIYSELPILKLKALALVNDKIIYPKSGQAHTYSIPKYSSIAVNFAFETDPANERVYGAGFFLDMNTSTKAPFSGVFDNWWRIWKDGLSSNKQPIEIHSELNNNIIRPIPLEVIEHFLYLLKKLKMIIIFLTGEKTKSGSARKQTQIIYQFATINKSDTNKSEAKFTKEIIKKLYTIFELCNIVENYVVSEGYKAGTYYGPITSVFYWSKRQLNNFQDMLERNLNYIIDDFKVWRKFLAVISLFTPSDSEVAHPYQHKKLFNVQDFAETILGFPSIISYTWHEIAKKIKGINSSGKFWLPHFNYMDFSNWYEMLLENDTNEKMEKRKEIQRQLMHKIRTINNLRKTFQIESQFAISKHSFTISKERFQRAILPSEYHSIAQVWYLFSKLTNSMKEMDTEYFRTIYPEFSIAKLAAAKVSKLMVHRVEKKYYYTFQMRGLSSNMKINEGARVMLIPNEKRDMNSNFMIRDWTITIENMGWSSKINGYKVKTEKTKYNFFEQTEKDKNISEKPEDLNWFLFPTSLDAWSNKLYRRDGLLQRHNFGLSWLGGRLGFLWQICSKQELKWPRNWHFTAPSVYLFAPNLLLKTYENPSIVTHNKLLTSIYPTPDLSQERAISLALDNIISGIQGPPGTGKSQTIAALIDEYYKRCKIAGKKSIKILITSFSYAAIRVIIDIIRKSRDIHDNPTDISHLQMVFIRSEYQEPIIPQAGCKDVDDLLRYGTTWKLNNQARSVTQSKLLEESLEENFIIFSNAHQLYYLKERVKEDFAFDLICVDEASQLPVDYFMSSLQFVHNHIFIIKKPKVAGPPGTRVINIDDVKELQIENKVEKDLLTKIVIIGDFYQLPPVQPVPPPKNLEIILKSLSSYYIKSHKIPNTQLQINYRSHKDIVKFTSSLEFYRDLQPYFKNAERTLPGELKKVTESWVQTVLDPQKVVSTIIHKRKFEIGVSSLEAEIVVKIIHGYYEMVNPKSKNEEIKFWKEDVGIVAPHNAQGRLIIRRVYEKMTNLKNPLTRLDQSELMKLLKNTIYSVEKFQGSDRELIISSIGISDKDQLIKESEFIYNLNRFNVLTSRAKCKIILVVSKKFLKFIPKDRNIMEEAAQIRKYAFDFCNKSSIIKIKNEKKKEEKVEFRYKK